MLALLSQLILFCVYILTYANTLKKKNAKEKKKDKLLEIPYVGYHFSKILSIKNALTFGFKTRYGQS